MEWLISNSKRFAGLHNLAGLRITPGFSGMAH